MQEIIKNLIQKTLKNLKIKDCNFSVEHPADLSMGDYSTNVAMVLAKKEKINPKELAGKIVLELNKNEIKEIEKVEIAGAGFINFYLSPEFFVKQVGEILDKKGKFGENDLLKKKKVMVEYTQPNPFKPFHIGHLMSNAIGESISRLCEKSGAKVVRANYQGDIGPHVAKAIYALMKYSMPDKLLPVSDQAQFIGSCYVKGNEDYENDENVKKEIDEINKKIYEKSDAKINEIYDWGRKITLDAFEEIYKTLGTKFDKYYFESEMAPIGLKIVKKNTGLIFEVSDGAIVFKAEKYDPKLHTRVFINSKGLPTYETKELGLTLTKFKKNLFSKKIDLSIITTATEQAEYMKVVQKAIELMHPNLENRMKHITHGMLRFASGKMSSRKGNVIAGESLIEDARVEIAEKIKHRDFTDDEKKIVANEVGVAALKYSILKQAIGGDIIYDFEKSISFEGDSGPYLQYSYARAKSILEKAEKVGINPHPQTPSPISGEIGEGAGGEVFEIEKLLYRFPEIVLRSAQEFEPHYIANYLIDLSRAFNTFYGNTKIINKDDLNSPYKVALTEAFSIVMKNGLYLLGIKAPERM